MPKRKLASSATAHLAKIDESRSELREASNSEQSPKVTHQLKKQISKEIVRIANMYDEEDEGKSNMLHDYLKDKLVYEGLTS